jgi:hypothetical protein
MPVVITIAIVYGWRAAPSDNTQAIIKAIEATNTGQGII